MSSVPDKAFGEPVHLTMHPGEPIRGPEAAAKVVRRHAGEGDHAAEELAARLEQAEDAPSIAAAEAEFRTWAEAENLLLVPPEDA